MKQVVAIETMDVPPERAFSVLTDLAHAAGRVKGITKLEVLTPGMVGKGTRFRETRVMFGKEATEEMEITAFDPPRSYTVEAWSHGCHYVSVLAVRPDEAGSVVEMTFSATPLSFMAKVLSPLMGLMARSCRKMMRQDLADLKAAAEAA
ncbi:MAG: SRPBCC family protein [Phycisphaerae bacterium]|nr:SRPBCC family protein [Phycisphaerae bacterium]